MKKLNFFLCQCFVSGNTLGARCSWNKHPLEVEELRGASWGNSLLQRHITLHIKTLIKQGFPPNSQEEITYLTGQFHVFYTFFLPPSCTLVPPLALHLAQAPEGRDFRHMLPSLYPAPTMLSSLTSPGYQRRFHNFPSHALQTSSNYLVGSLHCNPQAQGITKTWDSRLALASLGSLSLVMPQPWALPYTWRTLPPSQVSLHCVKGSSDTPVHHPKNSILGLFWMAKPRTLFTGVRIFYTYAPLSPMSFLPPTHLHFSPTYPFPFTSLPTYPPLLSP
jgi:hypothetical protein